MVEAAVGRTHLILRPDRLADDVLLDVDALVGELAAADHPPLEGVKRQEEADGEGRARSHPAAGREVAVVVDLDAPLDPQESQHLPGGGMLDLVDRAAGLVARIDDSQPVFEERRQTPAGDVAVFIDRRGKDRAAMLAVPRRVVGPAAEERDPEGGAGDDHAGIVIVRRTGGPVSLNAAPGMPGR